MDPKVIEEFKAVCEPVSKFIRDHGNPYTKVLISDSKVEFLSTDLGLTTLEKDD